MEFTIKQVAEKTHLTEHTLRYYEREGLLPFVHRSEGGMRRFTEADLEWLGLIRCLKSTGMSIRQIRAFVELSRQGGETLKQRCDMLRDHKSKVERQLHDMEMHLDKVEKKIDCFTAQYEAYQREKQALSGGDGHATAL